MKRELNRIIEHPGLSSHVYEIISKSLAWEAEYERKKDLEFNYHEIRE